MTDRLSRQFTEFV